LNSWLVWWCGGSEKLEIRSEKFRGEKATLKVRVAVNFHFSLLTPHSSLLTSHFSLLTSHFHDPISSLFSPIASLAQRQGPLPAGFRPIALAFSQSPQKKL
jgi:hypothetical protein